MTADASLSQAQLEAQKEKRAADTVKAAAEAAGKTMPPPPAEKEGEVVDLTVPRRPLTAARAGTETLSAAQLRDNVLAQDLSLIHI